MFILVTLLAACAVAPVAEPESSEAEATATPTEETASTDGFPRTIIDAAGRELTLDVQPQRIVAYYNDSFGMLATLGIMPVAQSVNPDMLSDPIYFGEAGESIPTLSYDDGPDLEEVAAAEPDLVLVYSEDEALALDGIAPAFVTPDPVNLQEVYDSVSLYGELLGLEVEAEAAIKSFQDRLTAYKTLAPGNVSVMVAGPDVDDLNVVWLRTAASLDCQLLSEIAACDWDDPTGGDWWSYETTPETLLELDPDFIYYWETWDGTSAELLAFLRENPLWAELKAIQNEQLLSVEGYSNPIASSLPAAAKILDTFAPLLYPDVFADGPLTDEQVNEILDMEERAMTDSDVCEAGFHAIEGAFGSTCIPVAPERIIAMNENVMANLIALGTPPIAVQDWTRRDFTQYLGDTTETIASVGTGDGPNYEAMLALKPDLILAMQNNVDEESMELLTQIAPVAVSKSDTVDWRGNILFAGEVTGKLAEAEALVAQTDQRLAEFRATYEAQADGEEIAIIRSRADSFNIYHGNFFIVKITEDAGLKMPASFSEITERRLSLEAIELIKGDRLFVMVRNERESGAFLDLSASPLWQTIPAVQNDEVYLVNWSVWVAGWNIVGANLVIDDLYFYMLGEEATTPNPLSDLIIPDYGPLYDQERLGLE
ncbi:MAG: ABC transporter substrate-binding protein [Chloroflexota bacterium]